MNDLNLPRHIIRKFESRWAAQNHQAKSAEADIHDSNNATHEGTEPVRPFRSKTVIERRLAS